MSREFLTSATGQLMLVIAALFLGVVAVRWQRNPIPPLRSSTAIQAPAVPLPKSTTRAVTKFTAPVSTSPAVVEHPAKLKTPQLAEHQLPLALFASTSNPSEPPLFAPFGRLIPCETVVALESNKIDTPIVGLVTEDVWHDGRVIVPAGTEVHGRASLDRARERITAQPKWTIVWRTVDLDNGLELSVDGIILEREFDPAKGEFGQGDGSAGIKGEVLRTTDDRELRLFASTFLAAATLGLQDRQSIAGLFGETSVPLASARNATLAGSAAVLRAYAEELKDSIARDGFYLRVPSGHPFYLYITETIDRARARKPAAIAAAKTKETR